MSIPLLSVAILANYSRGAEPLAPLSKDRDSVFRLEAFTATDYFCFGKDGKYRQIDREHMFTAEMDRGTWKQDETGQIELRSAILLKELKRKPLCISVRDVENLEALRPFEKDLAAFLSADQRDSYPRTEIEQAWKYSYTWSLFDTRMTVSAVEVEPQVEQVTRKQLTELLEAWRAYLKNEEKNRFHFLPVPHGKFVLLASGDYPFLANASTMEEVRQTASHCGGPDQAPALVYVLVDSAEALKEMQTNQPFLFYPDMNQEGRTDILRYKEQPAEIK